MPTTRTRPAQARQGNKLLANVLVTLAMFAVVWPGIKWAYAHTHKDVPTPHARVAGAAAPVVQSPIRIEAQIPQLDVVQGCMLSQVITPVLDDFEDPNAAQVWLELLFTESSFYHWVPRGTESADCSFIRESHENWEILNSGPVACGEDLCVGLGQLSSFPEVCDPALRFDPFENVYCSARYFGELVDQYGGDFTKAVAKYKGAVNLTEYGTQIPDTQHPHVLMVFKQLTLTK
ncbi:MAG: lytic transglycosylase domain-containing protein [bacterium]|nr:lytic transglycosylase domain-containing protein [bacterium]